MGVPICGPKLSMCCLLLSIWGIVMLTFMGIFMRINSPAFVEDLGIDETEWEKRNFEMSYIDEVYTQVSDNCFIAAGLYVGTLVISVIMWKVNQRANYNMS